MTPVRVAGLAASFVVAGLLAGDISANSAVGPTLPAPKPAFTEVNWPFLLDQWGNGRAFYCRATNCGLEINVYLRAKVGFCSCTNGVSDDNELERVGDLEIFNGRYTALEDGHIVAMGPFKGRARPFSVEVPFARPFFALALAVNNQCDAVVATVMTESAIGPDVERVALNFLNEDRVLKWADATTGLPP
jgi:hypothetical protein